MLFRRLSSKKQHEMTHTGDKRHKCSFCVQSFSSLSSKIRHEMTHTETNLINAGIVSSHSVGSHLRNNMKWHTREKPHKWLCSYCVKSFRQLAHKNVMKWLTQERNLILVIVSNPSITSETKGNMKWHTLKKPHTLILLICCAKKTWRYGMVHAWCMETSKW